MQKRTKWLMWGGVTLFLFGWLLWSNLNPVLTNIEYISETIPKAFDGYRILQVSDLHDACFGKDNSRLIRLARGTLPDLILITGDHVDSSRPDISHSLAFSGALMEIAPVYYISGNHEALLPESKYQELLQGMEALGIITLLDDTVEIGKDGDTLNLTGLRDVGFLKGKFTEKAEASASALASRIKPGFTILLAHRPELIGYYDLPGVDLMLSGHAHGGQVRLPLIGGLYAPGQGILPKYDAGLYERAGADLIVSRGLGNSIFPLRVNNRPELLLITLRRRSYSSSLIQAFSSSSLIPASSTFPSINLAPGQLGSSFPLVLPMPLPPEVAKGISVLPVRSYCSRKVLMMVGATYHQMGKPTNKMS